MKIIKIVEFLNKVFLYLKLKHKNIENKDMNSFSGMPLGQGAPFGNEMPPTMMGGSMDGGPMISGRWMNKRTGKSIMVRDSVMDGENMVIITDQGQIDMTEFSRDYIQVSDEVYNEQGNVVETKAANAADYCDIKPDYGVAPQETAAPKKVLNNFEVIDKIFTKIDSKPTIKFDIKWAKFPTNELQMLVNFLDVTEEDIAAYVVDKFVNQDEITEAMKTFVDNQMNATKDKAK